MACELATENFHLPTPNLSPRPTGVAHNLTLTLKHHMWGINISFHYPFMVKMHKKLPFASSLIALIWAMALAQSLTGMKTWSLVGTKPKNNVVKPWKESLNARVGRGQRSGGRVRLLVGGLAHTYKMYHSLNSCYNCLTLCTFTPLPLTLFKSIVLSTDVWFKWFLDDISRGQYASLIISVLWLGSSCLTSLSLSFFMHKMAIIIAPYLMAL